MTKKLADINKTLFRVQVDTEDNTCTCVQIGLDNVNKPEVYQYEKLKKLPVEVQERLSVLSVAGITSDWIEGIGKKISEECFWCEFTDIPNELKEHPNGQRLT